MTYLLPKNKKTCSKCGESRLTSEFYKDKSRPDGLYCYCKKCHGESMKSSNDAHSEERVLYRRRYYAANRGVILAKSREYSSKNKDMRREYRKNNPDVRVDEHRRRRARLRGSTVDVFKSGEIFLRDGWVCGLCHKRVDSKLKYPDPMSASLDHIVPLADGGSHERKNVQLTHLSCNVSAGVGGVKQLRMFG